MYWAMSGRRTDIFQPKQEPPHPPNAEEDIDGLEVESEPTASVSEQQETLPKEGSAIPPTPATPTPTAVNPEKPVPTEAPASTSSDSAENTSRTLGEQKTDDKRQPAQDEPSPRPTQTPPSPPMEDTGPLCRLCGTRKNRSTRLCRYCDVPRYLEDAEAQDLYMLMSGKKLQVRKKPSHTRTKTSRGWSSKSPRRKTADDYIRQMEREISEANLVALTIKVLAISLIGALLVLGLWNFQRIVEFLEDATERFASAGSNSSQESNEGASTSNSLAPYALAFDDLRPGYCVNDEIYVADLLQIRRVDCDEPHQFEVFYRGWGLSEDPEITGYDRAFELCDAEFERYVGVPFAESELFYFANARNWGSDRTLVCILHIENYEKTKGTAKGSMR